MKRRQRARILRARIKFLLINLATCASTNFIANGLCYYFFSGGKEKTPGVFCINATITALILALICGAFGLFTVDGQCEKGILPVGTYYWESNIIVSYFPKKSRVGQIICTALVVMVKFLFISAGIPVIFGWSSSTVPIIPGAILHGILAGGMAMYTMYYIMVARCAAYAEEHPIPASGDK